MAGLHGVPNTGESRATGFYLSLIGISLVVVGGIFLAMFALGTVGADQAGILVNNLSGDIEVVRDPGTTVYNALTTDFFTLDKTEQTIEMTARADRGDRRGVDHVRIKTRDGSDVRVDVTINYSIILDDESTKTILATSGLEDAYKTKWVRDFSRSICRNMLGQLDTESFYRAELRTNMAKAAMAELNLRLKKFGIRVNTVQVQSFRFYDEYERKIKEKKHADQEVEKQKSQARAVSEERHRRVTETKKAIAVEIERYRGGLLQALLDTRAKEAKVRREADGYAYSAKKRAGAGLVKNEAKAKALLATAKAEASGTKAMCEALAGEGGRNLVLMEYAKKLKRVRLEGTPIRQADLVQKLQVSPSGRASGVRALTGRGGGR